MFAKLRWRKFAGVQQPLGHWFIRHVLEFVVLSPAILVTWLYLKRLKFEVIIVGIASSAISIFLAPLEPELRRRRENKNGLAKTIVLNLSEDANSHIRKLYDEVVTIYGTESRFRRRLVWWASKLGIETAMPDQVLSDSAWHAMKPSVVLSSEDREKGYDYLESIGIGRNQEFVCYATRTESYYRKLFSDGVVGKSRSIRNPDEQIYLDVGSRLSESGLPVIRMGKDLNTSVRSTRPTAVIDYATTNRTDALDCFLLNRCKFLINGATGIVWFRRLFNLSTLHCDIYDVRNTQTLGDLFLFQRARIVSSGEFATISEMLKMRSEYADERHQDRLGVELVKNSFDDILEACNEMNKRIDGSWVTTKEDEELQNIYIDLVTRYTDLPSWNGGGRVSSSFLRANRELLC
jgi:putative glycosyltransferase (TIGR04372 family)